MSSSRSPSNFFRSHRHSSSHQSQRRGDLSADDALVSSSAEQHYDPASPQQTPSASRRTVSSLANQMTLRGMERLEKRRTMEERNFLQSRARSYQLRLPVDLRLLDYVTIYDDNLVCPICRCPFVDPVILTDCDHCFCRDCIRQTWTVSSPHNPHGPRGDCPSCRTPAKLGPRSATSKILINILDDLMVKCPKSDDGCEAEVKRGEIQDHMSIYCGFALVACPARECELSMRRKDTAEGCLHYPVSCLACKEEMQKSHLETHWKHSCPGRTTTCQLCRDIVSYRDLSDHNERWCSAISVKCPGEAFGCTIRSKRSQVNLHAKGCTFALLAPLLGAQKQRLDEQEAAQKEMSRRLEVLESGFANMHSIMYRGLDDPDHTSADPSSIPLLTGHGDNGVDAASGEVLNDAPETAQFHEPTLEMNDSTASLFGEPAHRTVPQPPDVHPGGFPEWYSFDHEFATPFPPPSTNGPYASPLHHLLSMHESLRQEMSRVNTTLQELDGRHSMQILNENLRTREEITYISAQVAGLSRQVHWLTSAQLQRPGRSATPGASTQAGDIATAGPSVEAAISSAVRGAVRIVNAGREGMAMRRGPSEEGRTKL